jgi:hypothetical protein
MDDCLEVVTAQFTHKCRSTQDKHCRPDSDELTGEHDLPMDDCSGRQAALVARRAGHLG